MNVLFSLKDLVEPDVYKYPGTSFRFLLLKMLRLSVSMKFQFSEPTSAKLQAGFCRFSSFKKAVPLNPTADEVGSRTPVKRRSRLRLEGLRGLKQSTLLQVEGCHEFQHGKRGLLGDSQ